jgi:hypothetical protein
MSLFGQLTSQSAFPFRTCSLAVLLFHRGRNHCHRRRRLQATWQICRHHRDLGRIRLICLQLLGTVIMYFCCLNLTNFSIPPRYLKIRGNSKRHTVNIPLEDDAQESQRKSRVRRTGLLTVAERPPGDPSVDKECQHLHVSIRSCCI